MKELGVGVVGYGFMGKTHTYAYKSLSMLYEPAPARINLVGAAVRNPDSQQLAVEQGGYQFATADYRELIARDDIDIINCSTPNDSHKEIVLAAMQAGKHVYVDKPLAAGLCEAEEITDFEAQLLSNGDTRTRQMAHNYRFVPAIMRAREIIEEGRLGRIFTFSFRYIHNSNADPSKPLHWKTDRSVGGGVMVDLGSHIVDLALYLLGDFDSILAHPFTQITERPGPDGNPLPVNGDDACYVMARMHNGAVGTLEASKLATGSNDELTFDIRGENGALLFNLMDPNWLHFFDGTRPERPLGGERGFTAIECVQRYPKPATLPGPKLTIGWMRFHIHSIYDFVSRVVEGKPGSPSFSDALRVHQVLETCYNSPGIWTSV